MFGAIVRFKEDISGLNSIWLRVNCGCINLSFLDAMDDPLSKVLADVAQEALKQCLCHTISYSMPNTFLRICFVNTSNFKNTHAIPRIY